jgi:hypothetical protein
MVTPFAYGAQSSLLVATDAQEVFVCAAGDQNTQWTFATPSPIVGVRTTRDAILVLEASGILTRLQADNGSTLGQIELKAKCHALAATPAGDWAAVTATGVIVGRRDAIVGRIDLPGATHAAWAITDDRLAIADGKHVHLYDKSSRVATRAIEDAITGLAASAIGDWLVTTTHRLLLFSHDLSGATGLATLRDAQLSGGVVSPTGQFVAFRIDHDRVAVLGMKVGQIGLISYPDREVGELEFGPHPELGIGIGQGDGNLMSLLHNQARRTDPPPDRQRNRWLIGVMMDGKKAAEELKQKPEPVAPAGKSGCLGVVALAASVLWMFVALWCW